MLFILLLCFYFFICSGSYGGAISLYQGILLFEFCSFSNNTALNGGADLRLNSNNLSSCEIINCLSNSSGTQIITVGDTGGKTFLMTSGTPLISYPNNCPLTSSLPYLTISEPPPTSTTPFPNGCSFLCILNEINQCSEECDDAKHFEIQYGICVEKELFHYKKNTVRFVDLIGEDSHCCGFIYFFISFLKFYRKAQKKNHHAELLNMRFHLDHLKLLLKIILFGII
jgi:hypothetical protein